MKSQQQRNALLRERNEARGLIQARVWIPEKRRDELKQIAARWRDEYDQEEAAK